jgi:hypothetical protein
VKPRRILAIAIVSALYLGAGVASFIGGKAHTIYAVNPSAVPVRVQVGSAKEITVKPNGIRIVGVAKGLEAKVGIVYPDGKAFSAKLPLSLSADRISLPVAGLSEAAQIMAFPAPANREER